MAIFRFILLLLILCIGLIGIFPLNSARAESPLIIESKEEVASKLNFESFQKLLSQKTKLFKANSTKENQKKNTVVIIWAGYCDFCKALIQLYSEAQLKNEMNNVKFIGVSMDDEFAEAQKALNSLSIQMEHYYDDKGEIRKDLMISKIPVTIIFNSKNELSAYITGAGAKKRKIIMDHIYKMIKEEK